MILQAEVASEVVKNAFDTNPDTVFGVLVSILLLLIIGLVAYLWKKDKDHIAAREKSHTDHKQEIKEIFVRHENAQASTYKALTEISNKTLENLGSITAKIDELIRAK